MKRKHKAAAPQSSDSTATLPASKKTTETVVATAPSADTSHIISKIEQDLQEAIFAVKDGTHAEVAKRSNNLLRIKDKRVATADRHRKLQIKNINELYDYEVQDSEALFQRSYTEMQDKLIAELKHEAQKLKVMRLTAPSNETDEETFKRTTRSSGPTVDNDLNSHFLTKEKSSARRKVGASSAPAVNSLQKSIPLSAIREDFLEIVKDMETRAINFAASMAKVKQQEVLIVVEEDGLRVGEELYELGDFIVAFSTLSQEDLSGMITHVSHDEVIVRTQGGKGTRFSFHIAQLKSGRVIIRRDSDAKLN